MTQLSSFKSSYACDWLEKYINYVSFIFNMKMRNRQRRSNDFYLFCSDTVSLGLVIYVDSDVIVFWILHTIAIFFFFWVMNKHTTVIDYYPFFAFLKRKKKQYHNAHKVQQRNWIISILSDNPITILYFAITIINHVT